MNSGAKLLIAAACLTAIAQAQVLTNAALNGAYSVRQVQFTADGANNVTDARSIIGSMTFNGAGQYSFTGQQAIGTGPASSYSASGSYSMSPSGALTLTNPQKASLTINARYSTEAVAGASTDAAENTFDLFVAIPGSSATPSAGNYAAVDFELGAASTAQVRDSIVSFTLDGAGSATVFNLRGHAANVNAGAPLTVALTGVTFSGTALAVPQSSLMSNASRTFFVSQSGNVILAGTPSGHDIFIGVRASAAATVAPSTWLAGIRVDSGGASESYAGSAKTINGAFLTASRRLHETGSSTPLNVTSSEPYTIAADGTGSAGSGKVAMGAGGNLMLRANLNSQSDPSGYEIALSFASPSQSGTGVFIYPQGVVNAASLAPAIDSISPGEFIAIYGSGLAAKAVAALPPYPLSSGGVTVSIGGLPAPLYFVSPGQINCLVPYAISGTTANIIVTNGAISNTVTVPVSKTSPGIFTLNGSGTLDGAILHVDASLVNAASPAKKGEIVTIYMTGLGALATPVPDGKGATAADSATTQLQLFVNGVPVASADVLYAGLSSLPGLYQINFRVPASLTISGTLPLAIQTPEAFHDQVSIAVQ